MKLILASQSPRRKELLSLLGKDFTILVPSVDETMEPGAEVSQQVALVSRRKAMAVPCEGEDVVIAADTIVVCDGEIMGKPRDTEDAFRMLSMLSGRTHQVMTGFTVRRGAQVESCTEVTDVTFREVSQGEIRRYIASGEPMDKAGSYGIQGGAALFVTGICGDYYNVMGLPVCRLTQVLKSMLPNWLEEHS